MRGESGNFTSGSTSVSSGDPLASGMHRLYKTPRNPSKRLRAPRPHPTSPRCCRAPPIERMGGREYTMKWYLQGVLRIKGFLAATTASARRTRASASMGWQRREGRRSRGEHRPRGSPREEQPSAVSHQRPSHFTLAGSQVNALKRSNLQTCQPLIGGGPPTPEPWPQKNKRPSLFPGGKRTRASLLARLSVSGRRLLPPSPCANRRSRSW